MTHFIKQGSSFMVATDDALDIHETLPVGTYTVGYDSMRDRYFLEIVDSLTFSGKVYGDTEKTVSRILATFDSREVSTGVLLTGEKGSGKTLLAKLLSIRSLEKDVPTIIINQPWFGDTFNRFMQSIDQPTVVLFDEFEKVYDKEEQEQLLTLLDGVYPSKKLFVLTCNDKWRIDAHMRNRPGRIYYGIDFTGLDPEFIEEYCNENLDDKSQIDSVIRLATMFEQFNFDMLKALVEEMNRYQESAQDAAKLLNTKPEVSTRSSFKVSLFTPEGVDLTPKLMDNWWEGNPISQRVDARYWEEKEDSEESRWIRVGFSPGNIIKLDGRIGSYEFLNEDGMKLILKKPESKAFVWDAF